jgi:hypothetical protein
MPEPRYGVLNLIEIGLAMGWSSGDYHMRENSVQLLFSGTSTCLLCSKYIVGMYKTRALLI